MTKDEDPTHDLLTLINYIKPLVNANDDGLSHQELARKADVSEAMVSKIRKKLLAICDIEHYSLQGRKFRLKYSFDTGFSLLIGFVLDSNLNFFVKSRYFRYAVLKIDFHELICKKFQTYGTFFTPEDTRLLVKIIVENIQITPETKWKFIKAKNEQHLLKLLMEDLHTNVPVIVSRWKLTIKSEEELLRIVDLRRKLQSMVKQVVASLIENMLPVQFLKKRNDPKYSTYMEAYRYLADHYIDRIFNSVNGIIRKSCPPEVKYKNEYDS
ncbi:hypothetical protein [Nitrososphaera sp.]|uniref:hypothetical protein n=1 Tax=Nitrososphaera sp. TaxID=1971748 RepID=UPI00181EF673|nr:hypothetical protein [Nitrososphaera sp.]NWG37402.1 hypothetical protein [Nitrososphaera sp.]